MTGKDGKKGVKALLSHKLSLGLSIGLSMGLIAALTGFLDFSRNLELLTLDLRYRLRPQIETLPELGFIDYDDSSLELFGEWPWHRFRQVALVRTLDFYDARMAGYDVFFVEKENTMLHTGRLKKALSDNSGASPARVERLLEDSFKNYDREFAGAIRQSGNIYLAYFSSDPDEKTAGKGLRGILQETERKRQGFSALKKEAVLELEKTFLPVPGHAGKSLYKTIDIDAPVPVLARAAKGLGFAQPGIDSDSVRRNYIFFRYYNEKMLYAVTLKMLSDILDFRLQDIELHPGKYIVLKNALDYKTGARKDINIPVDEHCQTLLNWAGTFKDTYMHVPFRLISYYYAHNTAKQIARNYENAGIEKFPALKEHIFTRIMEESMVAGDEAEKLSAEVTAAHFIAKMLNMNLSGEEILRRLSGSIDTKTLSSVLEVVSAGLKIEKELSKNPSLTFEQFTAQHPMPGIREPHLKEIFRNMSFFANKNRLAEAKPYYFPAPMQTLRNGRLTDFSPVELEGKIFMIGLTGTNTIDLKPTPFEKDCPLVAYHVNSINTVLTGNFLRYPPENYKYAAAVLLSLLIGAAGGCFSIPVSFALTSVAAAGYLFATYKLWELKGYWLDWVVPLTGIILTYIAIVVIQFIKAFREKKRVRDIFSAMVSPAVLKVMEENPGKFSLTGERKPVTTFFSMINNMSEVTKTLTPDELTDLLSIYLTPNSGIIMDYDGYIDKYEGHVIMADFGVPLDDECNPWKCAFSAIEQKLDIEAFVYYVRAKYGLKVGVSMGFNYGYVSAGNMGSEKKFQYTVMGDPVNVAARFMASNHIYNSIFAVTGEDTLPVISDYVHLRQLDRLLLKGKTKPTAICSVLGWKPEAYLKLRGGMPVPDSLVSLWTKCPPEKIFAYSKIWDERHKQTGHPLAGSFHKFFSSSLDTAKALLAASWKKEIAECHEKIEMLKAGVAGHLNGGLAFVREGRGSGFEDVLQNWETNLKLILELAGSGSLPDKGKDAEAFLSHAVNEGRMFLNKVEMLRLRLRENAAPDSTDRRIEEAMREIRDSMANIAHADTVRLEQTLREKYKKYRLSAGEFYKSIKNKREEYHELMSIAGSPSKDELAATRNFEEGLDLYRKRRWDEALEKFRSARELSNDKRTVESFIERIENYRIYPPGDNWQGEFGQAKK